MGKRTIAVFDFDGTITKKDTFTEFIKFTRSKLGFILGFVVCIPYILSYKWKILPNYVAKQKIFSYFFKGMKYSAFCEYSDKFSAVIDTFVRQETITKLHSHQKQGHKIYVISAGGEEWIKYWCKKNGIDNVLATKSETDSKDCLTGRFLSKNCYGEEKVRRLLEVEPDRENYILYAYGDSAGDIPMINFSDHGEFVNNLRV